MKLRTFQNFLITLKLLCPLIKEYNTIILLLGDVSKYICKVTYLTKIIFKFYCVSKYAARYEHTIENFFLIFVLSVSKVIFFKKHILFVFTVAKE